MATRDERQHDANQARWRQRKSPVELGRFHANIGRSRSDNPFSESLAQSREDWFRGFDQAMRNR